MLSALLEHATVCHNKGKDHMHTCTCLQLWFPPKGARVVAAARGWALAVEGHFHKTKIRKKKWCRNTCVCVCVCVCVRVRVRVTVGGAVLGGFGTDGPAFEHRLPAQVHVVVACGAWWSEWRNEEWKLA